MIVNGIDYPIKYTNRSLLNIEERLGIGILTLIKDNEKMTELSTVTVFAWAGIGRAEVSFDDVVDAMEPEKYSEIIDEISAAITKAFNSGSKKK